MNAAGEGFAPKPFEQLDEADWDAAFGATAKGSFFVTPGRRAAPARVGRLRGDDRGRRRRTSRGRRSPRIRRPRRRRRCSLGFSRARSRPRCASAVLRPVPSRSSRGQEERRAAETLLGRVGSPDDIADAVVYLAGATFVTGTTLVVDGGRSLKSGAAPEA